MKKLSVLLAVIFVAACAATTPTPVVSRATATPAPSPKFTPSAVEGLEASPTPTPVSTATKNTWPTATALPNPTLVAPLAGDLILRLGGGEFRLWREGSSLEPARREDFDSYFREPSMVRAQRGDRLVSFPLELLPERRAVRLIRPAGDGPSKEVMYSDDKNKNFVVGTVAGSDWGYAVVIQSNGRELELFFGEPLNDHHQGAAKQRLPPWIRFVHRVYWQGENLLMIARTSEGKFAVVRVRPGAKQKLPSELAPAAWNVRHELSEPLMRYNKSLRREYQPIWLGDEVLVDLAIVK